MENKMRHNTKGKRFLALVLAAVLMLSVCPVTASAEDTDCQHKNVNPLEAVEPTCTEDGLTAGKQCLDCNAVTEAQQTIPATGHSYDKGKVTQEPTAEEAGVRTYTCSVCGETYTEEIPATGPDHHWDEGKVTTQATCTAEGVMTYTCTDEGCEETKTETIPATGHSYGEPTWDRDENEENFIATFVCATCGASETVTATIDEDGKAVVTFGNEKYSYEFEVAGAEELVPVNAPDAPTANANVSKSKTATNLDTNFESQVTLSLPSAEEPVGFDVVFVIDKSESPDKEEVSKAVGDLLDEIKGSKGTVNIGVVTFNKEVANCLNLTPLTDSNLKTIQDAIEFSSSSGTNIHAGLTKGMEILDAGKNTGRQYLILVSDGITYLYNDQNGQGPKTINNHGQSSPDDYKGKYETTDAPDNWKEYLDDIATLVNADGTTYEGTYIAREEIVGAEKGLYGSGGYGNDPLGEHAMSVDKALLRTYEAYVEAMGKYGKNHVYAVGRANSAYPWAGSFMNYLSSISAKKTDIDTIVKEDILYLVANGSKVTDYIGSGTDNKGNSYNFDFVNEASKLWMTIGDEKYEAASAGENKYVFKNGAYELEYSPDSEAEAEHFVWYINEPIRNDTRVQLTYTVKLTNPQEAPGTYGEFDSNSSQNKSNLYTNNSATLYPQGSDGTPGTSQEFAKPTVSYTVQQPNPDIQPSGPAPDWGNSKSKTATNLDKNFESKVTLSLPAASYKGNLDVAFVLDGSTSADQAGLAEQAASLLNELAEMENLNVKASLTVFGGSVPILEDTWIFRMSRI